jgi:hypothetical protein
MIKHMPFFYFGLLRNMDALELERKGRLETIKKMRTMTRWVTREQLIALVGRSSNLADLVIEEWVADRRIFAVDSDGYQLYGAFQFDGEWRPIPVIAEILALLRREDCWAIASWFLFPNGWIGDPDGPGSLAPANALKLREKVLNAAEKERGTYFC